MIENARVKWDSDEVVMVTGGAGFIGSHIVRELANQEAKVVVFDMTPDASYIADVTDRVEFVYGDVADAPHLMGVIKEHGVGVIIHLGYMLVPDTYERMGWAIRSNCLGFQAVMEAARVLGVRRVVWASSQSVYGRADMYPPGPVSEDVVPNPTLVYGACKLFNEHVARHYREEHDLDNFGYRKSVAFGLGKSRLRDYSIAHLLVENAILGRTVEMPPVDYHANWLYVKDIVRAYLLGALAPRPEHGIFNIGGFTHRCSEVIEILRTLVPDLKVKKQPGYVLSHPIEVYDQDQTRAKEELGYEPVYTLEEAAKDYMQTIKDFGEQYKATWTAYRVKALP